MAVRGKAKKQGAPKKKSPASVLSGFRASISFVILTSAVVNLLALTGAFYMMQVYDRALTSQSVPTLYALSALCIGLYVFQGVLDILRSQVLVRLGARIDSELAPLAHKVAIDMPRFGYSNSESLERGRDVDTLRQFFGGSGPIALLDLPWIPLYLVFVYLLHPWLGITVFGGAIVLTIVTVITEVMTHRLAGATHQAAMTRSGLADSHARNAEVLKAMGFANRAVKRFEEANEEHVGYHTRTNDIGGTLSGLAKVMRMILQSAILGLGAYLAIHGELSAGAIMAASIIAGRALAPVDQAIAQWKGVVGARRSYSRLGETLTAVEEPADFVELPAPRHSLKIERLTVATPSNGNVVLSDISFELNAGQAMGLVGPSGSGKSSLARGLTDIWPVVRGSVRLDDAEIKQWRTEDLGRHIGFLPQDVALLEGSIAENISRFGEDADSSSIVAAAKSAGVHEMIVRLPQGYQTELGPNGTALSAGQRQRIALARALYGNPFLVVLDEPNSNLDSEGDAALTEAIKSVRQRGGIVIVIAHRPSALVACDMVGVVQNGRLSAFGPKDEIFVGQSKPQPVANSPRQLLAHGEGK